MTFWFLLVLWNPHPCPCKNFIIPFSLLALGRSKALRNSLYSASAMREDFVVISLLHCFLLPFTSAMFLLLEKWLTPSPSPNLGLIPHLQRISPYKSYHFHWQGIGTHCYRSIEFLPWISLPPFLCRIWIPKDSQHRGAALELRFYG